MFPAPFDYLRASSWEEAIGWLQEYEDDARVLAGGQSLVPMMNLRLVQASHIIDVNDVGDHPGIRVADGVVEIDALTRHSELDDSPVLAEACPLLEEAAGLIGNIRVRHRGTIGGSIAHADPSAELPCALLALGGVIRVQGPGGERRIPAKDFFVSFFTTALEAAEVVVGVEVPKASGSSGSAFLELVRRAGDFATVEVATVVEFDGAGNCSDVRVALGGIGDRPVDMSEQAEALVGSAADDEEVAEAARSVAAAIDPRSDERASAEYRRHLAEVVTRRALMLSRRRGRGEGDR